MHLKRIAREKIKTRTVAEGHLVVLKNLAQVRAFPHVRSAAKLDPELLQPLLDPHVHCATLRALRNQPHSALMAAHGDILDDSAGVGKGRDQRGVDEDVRQRLERIEREDAAHVASAAVDHAIRQSRFRDVGTGLGSTASSVCSGGTPLPPLDRANAPDKERALLSREPGL